MVVENTRVLNRNQANTSNVSQNFKKPRRIQYLMKNTFRKIILILAISISIFTVIVLVLKQNAKSIVNIPEQNEKYFVVVYGDEWLKISKSKKELFFNKVYSPCFLGVVVPFGEKIKVYKPKNWRVLSKRQNITNGLEIDFYTNGDLKYNQTEIDSLSLNVIQNCGK